MSSAADIAPKTSSDRVGDSLYRKIAWHIMPIVVIGYIIAYIDRVNVSFARLQMLGDLKFSDSVYGGKKAARRAARKFKRRMLRRLPRRKSLGG